MTESEVLKQITRKVINIHNREPIKFYFEKVGEADA